MKNDTVFTHAHPGVQGREAPGQHALSKLNREGQGQKFGISWHNFFVVTWEEATRKVELI